MGERGAENPVRRNEPAAPSSADQLSGVRRALQQGLGEDLGRRRLGPREPRLGVGDLRRIAIEVEEDRGYVNARDAVDQAVVRLADDREAPALETIDEPHLPDRLGAVQPLGEDAGGEGL
jgi:hypothetical protein